MAIFGVMRPKLIAKVMITAVMPLAIVALIRSNVVCEPLAICRSPLAILKRKTPGIIDTTEGRMRRPPLTRLGRNRCDQDCAVRGNGWDERLEGAPPRAGASLDTPPPRC